MLEDLATIFDILIKWGKYFLFTFLGIGIAHSIYTKIRSEPAMLAKLIFTTLLPPVLAIALPYYILHNKLKLPTLVCIIAGFAIYAFAIHFLDKTVTVKFKDED